MDENNTRYIFDPSVLVHEIDGNNVLLKTLSGKYRLSGEGIVLAVRRIIECFNSAALQEAAVEKWGSVYSKKTVSKLIDFLVSKDVLIPENAFEDFYRLDADLLKRYRRFGLGDKGLQQTFRELRTMTIGIVCTYQFAECFLSGIHDDQLIGRIQCIITDKAEADVTCGGKRIELSCFGDEPDRQIRELIETSDFIIANADYESFSMFSTINRLCLEKKKKWLRLVIQDEYAEIGPLFIPGETCCYACMDKRIKDNIQDAANAEYIALQKSITDFHAEEISTYSSYHFTLMAASVLSYEIMRYFFGMVSSLTGSVLSFSGEGYKMKLHKVFKISQCDCCCSQESCG